MARIYLGLAVFSFLLLSLNIALGLWTADYGEAADEMVAASQTATKLERSGVAEPQTLAEAKQAREVALARLAPLRSRATLHMLMGIAAALVAVLVNSISVTYFIGTSRWCREVVDAYHLDNSLADRSLQLKRRTFPWALFGILTIILLVGLGASSDPGANLATHLTWRTWHFLCGVLGTLFIGYAYLVQVRNVGANYRIIEEILAQVQQVRDARGLDSRAGE
ncbi:MAG TPA: hypothetical protein VL096_08105 [Pirellulaceae bacterium]|nr:hypothetical protein [Pirellulaceae bacterium]